MNTTDILSRIRKFYNLRSDKELAKFLGVQPQVLSNWKKRGTIKIDIIINKCKEMDLNYLLRGGLYDYQKFEELTKLQHGNFAERLKNILKHKHISQKELAEICNVAQSQVSRWLNGIVYPSAENLIKISKALNVDIHWLLTGEGEPKVTREFAAKEEPAGAGDLDDRLRGAIRKISGNESLIRQVVGYIDGLTSSVKEEELPVRGNRNHIKDKEPAPGKV